MLSSRTWDGFRVETVGTPSLRGRLIALNPSSGVRFAAGVDEVEASASRDKSRIRSLAISAEQGDTFQSKLSALTMTKLPPHFAWKRKTICCDTRFHEIRS